MVIVDSFPPTAEMIRSVLQEETATSTPTPTAELTPQPNETTAYIESILMDEDSYDDLDGLRDMLAQLLVETDLVITQVDGNENSDNDRKNSIIADNIIQRLQAGKKTTSQRKTLIDPVDVQTENHSGEVSTPTHSPTCSDTDDHDDHDDHNNPQSNSKTGSTSPKLTAIQREERRRQKKLERQQRRQNRKDNSKSKKAGNSRSPKSSRSPQRTPSIESTQDYENVEGPPLSSSSSPSSATALTDVVGRIQERSAQVLQELDDYGSAWADVKAKTVNNDKAEEAVWGGRGAGGRGINRGLAVYRGRDAVVHNLTLSYGGGVDLLNETHLALSHGHRYGLMGQNGCGKSTLLRRIAAKQIPGWPLHLSVIMVEQEVLATPQSVIDVMTSISQSNNQQMKIDNIQSQIDELESLLEDPDQTNDISTPLSPEELETTAEQLSELYDELDSIQQEQKQQIEDNTAKSTSIWSKFDSRAKTILKGLQFPKHLLDVPGTTLSGGWRLRLALAKALYQNPDFLLLDEPTNHLDLSAVMFLEQYIVDNKMTVVTVSHDSHFLDAICTDMIKFENRQLKYHVGNYSSFRQMEEQTWTRNSNKADAVARKEKKAMEFINKQRSMANSKHRDDNKQRQAAERSKKLGRIGLFAENGQKFKLLAEGNTKRGGSNRAGHINGAYTNSAGFRSAFVSEEKHAVAENHQLLNFKFPHAPPLKGGGTNLISIEDGKFKYPPSKSSIAENHNCDENGWLLDDLSLNISYGSRIAILGKNGAGKSTLLKLLCGDLKLNRGEFHSHPNLKIAHISQHHVEQLASYLEKTPVEYFLEQHKAKDEQEARQFLGGFGIAGPLALQTIGTLSGGQKARCVFATVMCDAPQLLVLDEPTNHLDTDSLSSLADAVNKFEGAVVIVSHNQDFMAQCANELWTVSNGRVIVDAIATGDDDTNTFEVAFERYRESLRKELRKK